MVLTLLRVEETTMPIFVTDELAKELKCFHCQEVLSVPPITLYHGKGNLCGRCFAVPSETATDRNLVYETVAKLLVFPCRYKTQGCTEYLTWVKAAEHEEKCCYQNYRCPKTPSGSCSWEGSRFQLLDHFGEKHPELVLKPMVFELTVDADCNLNRLISTLGELFIMQTKYEKSVGKLYYSLGHIGKPKQEKLFSYQLEFTADKENSFSVIQQTQSLPDSSLIAEEKVMLDVDIQSLKSMLHNPKSIKCSIKISPLAETETQPKEKTTNLLKGATQGVDFQLLEELECPVCKDFMIPPIYNCESGHSVCSECRSELDNCPICRKSMLNMRNFALEKLTTKVLYPCKYRDQGCNFVANSGLIRDHENNCEMLYFKCPFQKVESCDWEGKFENILQHTEAEHSTSFRIGNNILFTRIASSPAGKGFTIISCYNEIFMYCYKHNPRGPLQWSVQHITNRSSKYMYELDFKDQDEKGHIFIINRHINNLTADEQVFERDSISLPLELIKHFINDGTNKIKYHFKIYPVHSRLQDTDSNGS